MLPTDVPDLAADVPKVCIDRKTAMPSEMKDILDADKEENHWGSHILKMRDKAAMSGVDWSKDPSTRGEEESASFGESCWSKLSSSWEP